MSAQKWVLSGEILEGPDILSGRLLFKGKFNLKASSSKLGCTSFAFVKEKERYDQTTFDYSKTSGSCKFPLCHPSVMKLAGLAA